MERVVKDVVEKIRESPTFKGKRSNRPAHVNSSALSLASTGGKASDYDDVFSNTPPAKTKRDNAHHRQQHVPAARSHQRQPGPGQQHESDDRDGEILGSRRFSTVMLENNAVLPPPKPGTSTPDSRSLGDFESSTAFDGADDDRVPREPGRILGVLLNYTEGVGLFSLWRFPNMVVRHGGAFIIVYIIIACAVALPLYYLETCVGGFTRLGPFGVWGCSRMMQGIGVASVFLSVLTALLAGTVTTWLMFYCFSSVRSTLPWRTDDAANSSWTLSRMPEDYHFWKKVTDANEGFSDNAEVPEPNLILCSMALFMIVALSLSRKFDGKQKTLRFVPGVLSTLAIFALFFTTTSRSGAMQGVEYAFSIQWIHFQDPRLWIDALVQLLFSFGCGNGVQALHAARRPYKAASMLHLALTFAGNLLTGIVAGLTVCMALTEFSADMDDLVTTIDGVPDGSANNVPNALEGPGISIVAYTSALARLHGAPAWAVLFFAFLSLSGYQTVGPCVRVISTFLLEKVGKWESRDRIKFVLLVSISLALISSAFFTKTGPHLVCLFENFAMTFGAPVVGIAECVALSWIYGSKQWTDDLAGFTGSERSFSTAVVWKYVTPISLLALLITDFASYDGSDDAARCAIWDFPAWVQILGWALASVPPILILGHMLTTYFCSAGRHRGLKELFGPSEDWSPAEETFYWLMRNLGGKYHVLPDPIILVSVDSLDPKGPRKGIPHGYAVEPDSYDPSQLHTNPKLQRRLLELLNWSNSKIIVPSDSETTLVDPDAPPSPQQSQQQPQQPFPASFFRRASRILHDEPAAQHAAPNDDDRSTAANAATAKARQQSRTGDGGRTSVVDGGPSSAAVAAAAVAAASASTTGQRRDSHRRRTPVLTAAEISRRASQTAGSSPDTRDRPSSRAAAAAGRRKRSCSVASTCSVETTASIDIGGIHGHSKPQPGGHKHHHDPGRKNKPFAEPTAALRARSTSLEGESSAAATAVGNFRRRILGLIHETSLDSSDDQRKDGGGGGGDDNDGDAGKTEPASPAVLGGAASSVMLNDLSTRSLPPPSSVRRHLDDDDRHRRTIIGWTNIAIDQDAAAAGSGNKAKLADNWGVNNSAFEGD